jgi:hypothetical protein
MAKLKFLLHFSITMLSCRLRIYEPTIFSLSVGALSTHLSLFFFSLRAVYVCKMYHPHPHSSTTAVASAFLDIDSPITVATSQRGLAAVLSAVGRYLKDPIECVLQSCIGLCSVNDDRTPH